MSVGAASIVSLISVAVWTMGALAPLDGQQPRAVVSGVVLDSLGSGVAGAEVSWAAADGASSGRAVRSDAMGRFRLTDVDTGRVIMRARRIGFRPAGADMRVVAPRTEAAEIRMFSMPQRMAAVNVRERRQPYDGRLAGFFERQAKRQGHFITRERLDRLTTFRLADILMEVPGVRVQSGRGGKTVSLRGASCSPLFFVDGFPASAGPFDVDLIDPSTLEGIEIYSGLATIPSQFLGPRGLERCGVIALWSRPAPARTHTPSQTLRSASAIDSLVESRAVFAAADVDQEAAIEDGTAKPVYPDSLWRAGQSGRVLVEFVVDADGSIEPGTIGVISASHQAFAAAVVAALEATTFRPALRGGRPVRQLVQLPFEFTSPRRTP